MTADRPGPEEDGGAIAPVTDVASAAVLVALSAAALLWLIPAQTDATAGAYDLSPAAFPSLAAGTVLVLSLALLGLRLRRWRRERPPAEARGPATVLLEGLLWTAVCVAAMAGLRLAGFVATSALLLAGGMALAGQRAWPRVAVIAIALPLLLDQAAWWLFTVDLP